MISRNRGCDHVTNDITLDTTDGQILHALQIWPRASWTDIGRILNIDPMTASRRWSRMQEAGVAWLSSYPLIMSRRPPSDLESGLRISYHSAVIELQVKPNKLRSVLAELSDVPELRIIRSTLGEWNLSLDWTGASADTLEEFILYRLSRIKGIRATRTFAIMQTPIEGSSWRYEALTTEQEVAVRQVQRDDLFDPAPPAGFWHPLDAQIIALIEEDPRMSYTEMARRADSTVTRMKRHATHLMRARDVIIRCDLSRKYSTRPITLRVFASVPPAEIAETIQRLKTFPEIRSCSLLLGKYNLMLNVWLAEMRNAPAFEAHLIEQIPHLRVEERDLVTRLARHSWMTMNEDGLKTGAPAARLK